MNVVFVLLLVGALVAAALRGDVKSVGTGALEGAGNAVTLAIGLIGVMSLWLGLLKIAEKSGLVDKLARAARPIFRPLFRDVPDGHPAISAMLLNIAANMLGLGTATNAQALFVAINTASLQLVPTTVIALRAAAHSSDPAGILLPTLAATACSLTVAIVSAKLLERVVR